MRLRHGDRQERKPDRVYRAVPARLRRTGLTCGVMLGLAAASPLAVAQEDGGIKGGAFPAENLIEWAASSNQHFCMVVVGNPGTIAPAIGNAAMSSKVAGGYSGTAEITATNSSYRATIMAPAGFSSSPNLSAPVTFEAEFSGTGATNFFNTPGLTEVRIKRGVTSISADLTAKIHGSVFAAGSYQAEITLRCE